VNFGTMWLFLRSFTYSRESVRAMHRSVRSMHSGCSME